MEDVSITIKVSDGAHQQAKDFLVFLRRAAKKHSVVIAFTTQRSGEFKCSIPRKDGEKFELFLQELMFNQGLYYYTCTAANQRDVARSVVVPIFEEFLQVCFEFVYPSLLRRCVLEGSAQSCMSPAGEFAYDTTARAYEALFHRWKLRMITGYEFIRDLDDLLTGFMLFQLEHEQGQKSRKFNLLVDECGKKDILRDRDIRRLFNKVHSLRTRGLHRLQRKIPDSELSQIALRMYFFFEYLDDYFQAQEEKTVVLSGIRYRRIRYGSEIRHWKDAPKGFGAEWKEVIKRPCHDCGVIRGELHLEGCDMETCPRCWRQYLGCECKREDDCDEEAAGGPSLAPAGTPGALTLITSTFEDSSRTKAAVPEQV